MNMSRNESDSMWEAMDTEEVELVFSSANELVDTIGDQNRRFEELLTVFAADPEICDLATRGLVEEQQRTFAELSSIADDEGESYTAIGALSLSTAGDVAYSESILVELEEDSTDKTSKIEALSETLRSEEAVKFNQILDDVKRLSPNSVNEVEALLASRTNLALHSNSDIRALEDEVLGLMTDIEQQRLETNDLIARQKMVDQLMQRGGAVWPLPMVLNSVLEQTGGQQAFIDELPVEPKLSPRGHEHLTSLRERHIDQPMASLYVAFYLSEHAGQKVTVDELANFLYAEEAQQKVSPTALRTRVTTILGPARDYVGPMLLSEGYVLQFGWRTNLENNEGRIKITGRTRIYRAVTLEEASGLTPGKHTEENHEGGFRDTFVVNSAVLPEATEVGGDLSGAESPPQEVARPEVIPEWVKDFKGEIGKAIQKLEELELLTTTDPVPLKVVRTKLRGRLLTDTGLDKLIQSGLFDRLSNISRNQKDEVALSPSELVVTQLYNEHKGPLRKDGTRQAIALEIIKSSVDAYFHNKERRGRGH